MSDQTSFARYYENDHLTNYVMSKMDELIKDEQNKKEIANSTLRS